MKNNLKSIRPLTNNEIVLVHGGVKGRPKAKPQDNTPKNAKIASGISQIAGQLGQAFQTQAAQIEHQPTQKDMSLIAQSLQLISAAAAITGTIITVKEGNGK